MIIRTNNEKPITTVSLNKTKPLPKDKLKEKQDFVQSDETNESLENKPTLRIKPESKIAAAENLQRWFIPARIAFICYGIYYLLISIIAFLAIWGGYNLIKPFFVFSFETSFSSYFLLEIAASFAFLSSIVYFYAAKSPQKFKFFYFLLVIFLLPHHIFSNLQKLQIELSIDFHNFLFFDTILTTILWALFLISVYPYTKTYKQQ